MTDNSIPGDSDIPGDSVTGRDVPGDLLELATLDGLDALDDAELDEVRRRLETEAPDVRAAYSSTLRGTREAMARVSETTAVEPPAALRGRILAAAAATTAIEEAPTDAEVISLAARRRRQMSYLAAATVAAIAVGALGWVVGARSTQESIAPQQNTAQQVFDADDVATSSGAVATGRATVTYSDSADAAVLVMNDVPPPQPGTVYQMWLSDADGQMTSAGTMTDADVAPSTTAVLTGVRDATALAFTVEPPGGSTQPTGAVVAELPLN